MTVGLQRSVDCDGVAMFGGGGCFSFPSEAFSRFSREKVWMRVFFFPVTAASATLRTMPVHRQISPHAAKLRRAMTDVERVMWNALRNRQIEGFKFRRQATVGAYIVDFLCVEARLVIEFDGGQHDEMRDGPRTAFIEAQGYKVQRFWNSDIVENLEGVLEAIRMLLLERTGQED